MKNKPTIQSVERALSILEAIGERRRSLSLKELSELLDLKPPTLHHLAQTLVGRGYLRLDSGKYSLGSTLFALADSFPPPLLERAREELRELLGIWPEANIILAGFTDGQPRTLVRRKPGTSNFLQTSDEIMNPYASASALAYQAFATREQRGDFRLRYPFSEYGSRIWDSLGELDGRLEEWREKGFVHVCFTEEDIHKLAVPIFEQASLVAAMAACFHSRPGNEEEVEKMIATFMAGASRLSEPTGEIS